MVHADPRCEAEHRVADTRSALTSLPLVRSWEQTQPSSRASCPGPISVLVPSVNVGARRVVVLNWSAGVRCAMGPGHEARDDTCGGIEQTLGSMSARPCMMNSTPTPPQQL